MRIRRTITVAALALALSGAAEAATLYTPHMLVYGSDKLNCGIVNVSRKELKNFTIDVLDGQGNAIIAGVPHTLAPGRAAGQSVNANNGVIYCRFTFRGGKNAARARACIKSSAAVSSHTCLPAW